MTLDCTFPRCTTVNDRVQATPQVATLCCVIVSTDTAMDTSRLFSAH